MDIPLYEPFLEDAGADLEELVRNGWVSPRGGHVTAFESDVTEFLGVEHGLAVDSGTAALHLALTALDIGPGDEVIVPDFTFGCLGSTVKAVGAEPVPADIDERTLGLDPEAVETRVTPRTEAVMVAHMFGHPADMDGLTDVADRHDLRLVEDAAQAFGSACDGRPVGSMGDIGCVSFSWNKTMTTGKGGFVATDDADLFARLERAADYGRENGSKRTFVEGGFNYRMDNIRAAIGRDQFDRLDDIIDRKRRIVDRYRDGFADAGIKTPTFQRDGRDVAPWLFYLLLADEEQRDAVAAALDDRDIGCMKFYRPLHTMPAFDADGSYPVSDSVAGRGIALPSHPALEPEAVEAVCGVVTDTVGNGG